MPSTDPNTYVAPPDLLTDRVILVTGAGDGIGRAAAKSFGAHGATVILLGRTVGKLESAYDEILGAGGPEPAISVFDLATAQGPEYFGLAEKIDREFGRLDGLLHNAGILGDRTPIEQYDMATWAEVLHVNLTAEFALTQVLLPVLRQSDDASIIFTSSGVGSRGRAYWGAYAVSKFGVEGLAQVLADEVSRPGLRVNCINPGGTATSMRATAFPGEDPATLPSADDIMAAYLWLMGPASRGLTGERVEVQKS